MHWFWRGFIAVAISVVTSLGLNYAVYRLISAMAVLTNAYEVGFSLSQRVLPAVVAISVYGILTYRYGPKPIDPETRCRKCGYILRGIPEPRCSECGERI